MRLYLDLTMSKNSEKDKCSAFLYIIGRTGREIYNTWTIQEEDQNKIDILFSKFEEYCRPKHNVTLERYRFNSRVQTENETLDEFITDLKKLAIMCEYNQLQSEMIRDRLVVGIIKTAVKERLLREPELTLESAISICRADEESQKGLHLMKEGASSNSVNAVKVKQKMKSRPETATKLKQVRTQKSEKHVTCSRCGYMHGPRACPAYGKTCKKCNRKNHFAKQCQTKRMIACAEVSSSDETEQEFFLGAVSNNNNSNNPDWFVKLNCHGTNVSFKLDTGAQANVISEQLLKELHGLITPTTARVTAYSGERIPVSGKTTLPCFHKGKKYEIDFIVASSPVAQSILGLKTCESMNLIQRVYQLKNTNAFQGMDDLIKEYDDTFGEIGCITEKHSIQLDSNVTPLVAAARRVPLALRGKLQKELERMEKLGVITKVEEPTEWVNPMIVVEKANGDLRVCMDPKRLNEAIKREHYQLPTLEEVTTEMKGAKFFSKLDASSGFWAVQLDDTSSKVCTFATPSGRYRFLRLPFGIKSAPEVFQKVIHRHFGDIKGVVSYEDDLCIWSETIDDHIARLQQVFERARKCGLKFNRKKCEFLKKELKYLGHILTEEGVKADPDKITGITRMPAPEDKPGLMRFLGMVTYLTKFVPNMSEQTAPLRELLQADVPWQWLPHHDKAFTDIKEILTTSPVLAYFDPNKDVVVTADACRDGLGAALLQDEKTIAYASRSLTSAEKNYAMIEKEMLAIVFGLERFHQYVYGRQVLVETDHKPLVAINNKTYDKCPARIQRFLLRLQKYDVNIRYKKGTDQILPDTLSRAVDTAADMNTEIPEEDVSAYVNMIVSQQPVSSQKLEEIKKLQKSDPQCTLLRRLVQEGWPRDLQAIPELVKKFWTFREEIVICNDILVKGQQIIVPESMKREMLTKIHQGHMGIEMSKQRARPYVYWPGMTKDIEQLISKCAICQTHRKAQPKLPLSSHYVPENPFEKVGADLFYYGKHNYLLIVDYTSKFFEVCQLMDTTSMTVIHHMKTIFARHGIPIQLITDNGPQFSSAEFRRFMHDWEILHNTSSPLYPRSNGLTERTVQTVKRMLKKAQQSDQDPYLSILNFRTTDKPDQPSPAEILMGRKLRTLLPGITNKPTHIIKNATNKRQKTQARYYNVHTKDQITLQPGDTIRYRDHQHKTWKPAQVVNQVDPRSYTIKTKSGVLRRNRQDILKTEEPPHNLEPDPMEYNNNVAQDGIQQPTLSATGTTPSNAGQTENPPHYTTRSGRPVVKPLRYRK